MPKGFSDTNAWSVRRILEACLAAAENQPEFGADDCLWCYAYEPRCVEARRRTYQAADIMPPTKAGLMAWDAVHPGLAPQLFRAAIGALGVEQ